MPGVVRRDDRLTGPGILEPVQLPMTRPKSLPIKRITLYKHGLGFFERRGPHSGEQLQLEFPRNAMDDVLKSLTVLDAIGTVRGVEFATPADRNPNAARHVTELSHERGLTDAIGALRGQQVRLVTATGTLEGTLLGVELEEEHHLERARISIEHDGRISIIKLESLEHLEVLDARAKGDLEFSLQSAKRDEDRSSATVRLSPGDHDLSVQYIAAAPAWRVSYRLISEAATGDDPNTEDPNAEDPTTRAMFLQGWGVFDNTLEEDLENVELSLMAGMPVSFRYALFEPRTPERPLVEDENRTVGAPIAFAGSMDMMADMDIPAMMRTPAPAGRGRNAKAEPKMSSQMMQSTQTASSGEGRGALFAYRIDQPVSVARGQSGMVPIVAGKLSGKRELLYNPSKHPRNPVASLRFNNTTGLTLERGPVTVLEEREYAGEAMLEFSPTGSELIVAFAIELGVNITQQHQFEMRLEKLGISGTYLQLQEFSIRTTTYELENQTENAVTVTLEHDRWPGSEIFDTPKTVTETLEFARWNRPLAARSRSSFEIRERQLQTRFEEVRTLDGAQLRGYLENKFLDQRTYAALEHILRQYLTIGTINQDLSTLEQERERIARRQQQIQANLVSLGRGADEGKLRARLVNELNALEDRLQAMQTQENGLRQQIANLETLARELLAKLAV
jgi:hypothetical protein